MTKHKSGKEKFQEASQKIDKYIFPSSTVSRMKRSINSTKSDKRERAFTLCLDKATMKVYPGEEHVEESQTESGYIEFYSECRERNHEPTGTFHTHITKDSKASAIDIHSNCHEQNDINCIGSYVDGKITCTVKKEQGTNCQYKVKPLLDEENRLRESSYDGNANEKLYEKVDEAIKENFKIGVLKV